MALKFIGERTVGTLNGMKSGFVKDDLYRVYDAGILVPGGVSVDHGDFVSWDGTKWVREAGLRIAVTEDTGVGSVADIEKLLPEGVSPDNKLVDQAALDDVTLDPSAVALGNVHLLDEVTSFAADAKILVDSETDGPGAMPKDTLLEITTDAASQVQPKSCPNTFSFEMGNMTLSASSITYSYSTTRARTKQGTLIKVNKGDVIGVAAGFQMYVSFTTTGESPYTVQGWITSYTCPNDGYVALLFRKGIGSDSATTFDELMNAVFVRALNSGLATTPYILSELEKKWITLETTMYGANTSQIIYRFVPPKNTICRIIPSKTSWNTSNIGGDDKAKLSIRKVLSDDSISDVMNFYRTNTVPSVLDVIVPDDAVAMEIFFRADSGESVSFEFNCIEQRGLMVHIRNALFNSVNHRGYNSVAPENTLPAFRLSAKMEFGMVETDVHLTADDVFVCIHDDTVNRTSDGTGNVADMTLEELKALDFGSWKSASYAGTKIPTYEEFLICCRNLGLKAYVELKAIGHYDDLIAITKRLGMYDSVTFISSSIPRLTELNTQDDSLRIGYVVTEINETVITSAKSLRTGKNKVFLDVNYTNITDAMIALAEADDFPVEVFNINSRQSILALNPYISGVTSDSIVASSFVYAAELGK